jgi:hypothetical chaperone protein
VHAQVSAKGLIMSRSIGLDFGTTNTVLAASNGHGPPVAVPFRHGDEQLDTFRTVLAFWRDQEAAGLETRYEAGPWAIERFVDAPDATRFLQSFKAFAASQAFQHTTIGGANYRFDDLLAALFLRFRHHAGDALAHLPNCIVLGRPVVFAGGNPDADLARARYEDAFRRFGFTTFHHVYEPVAAAYYFARRLTRDATVLVADFGGGTSDFSIIHFSGNGAARVATPLSSSGVAIAGDTFDYRIIDAVVSPRLGKGSQVKSWGKVLDFPNHYFANFARWHQLSLMKSQKVLAELRTLARDSLARDKIESFIDFIEADVGYPLYKAVSATKVALSRAPNARLHFAAVGTTIDEVVTRQAFEAWIAEDLEEIDAAVNRALSKANLKPTDIDKVFLTGGSSFVPAVQTRFVDRFGRDKVETGDQLLSIAYGLALIGQAPEIERWTA